MSLFGIAARFPTRSPARIFAHARPVLLVVCAALAIVMAWAPGRNAPYQYDDYVTPVKDPASQSLPQWWKALPVTLRPLTKLTFAVESSLGITDAKARRGLGVVVFLACAALVAMLARPHVGAAVAVVLATIWACHPVHAETVIALAGRSVLLALFFTLASALLLLHGWHRLALAAAILAVLARETAVLWLVCAACLMAMDAAWPARRRVAIAIVTATCVGALLVLTSGRLRELLMFSWGQPDAANQLGLQWAAVPRGLAMLFLHPAAFTVDIDFGPHGWQRGLLIGLALALYLALLAAVLRPGQDRAVRTLCLLWLALVIPLHSVVPKLDPLTARSFSASSAALVPLLAAAAAAGLRAACLPRGRAGFAVAALGALGYLVAETREKAALYRDPITLWRDAADRSTSAARPLLNLGTLLAHVDRLDEAKTALTEAVRRAPQNIDARERLAAVHVLWEARNLRRSVERDETISSGRAPLR